MPPSAESLPLVPKPPVPSHVDANDFMEAPMSPWPMVVGWSAAHGLMFSALAALTWLFFQQHQRVGLAWGILLHYLLPGAIGLLQTLFLRRYVRHFWLWFPGTLFGVPLCLLLNEGWGVLPNIGFGFGVAQAVLLRPRGIFVSLTWIVVSGVSWFLPWVAVPFFNPFAAHGLAIESNMEISPVTATAWAGLIYGTLTSSIFFLLGLQWPAPDQQTDWLDWMTPTGVYIVMIAIFECGGRNFDLVMQLRNVAVAMIFSGTDSAMTRWADPFLIGIPFLGGEIAYRVLTVSQRRFSSGL